MGGHESVRIYGVLIPLRPKFARIHRPLNLEAPKSVHFQPVPAFCTQHSFRLFANRLFTYFLGSYKTGGIEKWQYSPLDKAYNIISTGYSPLK